jgi:hypothetical protein
MWYIYTMEYYFPINNNESKSFAEKWVDGRYHVKWNKPDWERQILHVLSYMQSVDLKWQNDMNVKEGLFSGRNPLEGKRGLNMIKVLYKHTYTHTCIIMKPIA